jgi:ribonuclease Z
MRQVILITGQIAGLVLLLGVSLAYVFRGELATAIMARGAASNLGADRIGELEDGLHALFCGAGAPLPDPQRSGPCLALIAGGHMVVIDAGTNGVRNLQRMGFAPGRIDAVLLTHFHSDHIDGLGELAMLRWVGGAHTQPLPVYGPPGVEDVVAGFNRAYRLDAGYRTAHHGEAIAPSSGRGMAAHPFELTDDDTLMPVIQIGAIEVSAFVVDHAPVAPAVGYRVRYRDRALVVSGDTVADERLARHAAGADVLVHEGLAPALVGRLTEAATAAGQPRTATITRDILDYHTAPVDAARLAATAGVGMLVFHHVVPPLLVPGAEAAFLRGVDDVWSGPVVVARDGTLISLPAGVNAITHSERL